jgi:hypothetical protein
MRFRDAIALPVTRPTSAQTGIAGHPRPPDSN